MAKQGTSLQDLIARAPDEPAVRLALDAAIFAFDIASVTRVSGVGFVNPPKLWHRLAWFDDPPILRVLTTHLGPRTRASALAYLGDISQPLPASTRRHLHFALDQGGRSDNTAAAARTFVVLGINELVKGGVSFYSSASHENAVGEVVDYLDARKWEGGKGEALNVPTVEKWWARRSDYLGKCGISID